MLMDDPEKSGYRTPPQLESGGGGLQVPLEIILNLLKCY